MRKWELETVDGRQSFYGKAYVVEEDDGTRTLFSYDTPVVRQTSEGDLIRLWDDYSLTTGRHIIAFCGLNKAQYLSLPMGNE